MKERERGGRILYAVLLTVIDLMQLRELIAIEWYEKYPFSADEGQTDWSGNVPDGLQGSAFGAKTTIIAIIFTVTGFGLFIIMISGVCVCVCTVVARINTAIIVAIAIVFLLAIKIQLS